MSDDERRGVRFVCTDAGRHTLRELGRWALDEYGRAARVDLADVDPDAAAVGLFVRSAPRNARSIGRVKTQGGARALATFDERCPRCGRHDQVSAERFGRLVGGLLAAGCFELDTSKVDMSRLGR